MKKNILHIDFTKNPSSLYQNSKLIDNDKYPLFGRPIFIDSEHPLFSFFTTPLNLDGCEQLNTLSKTKNRNLYSSDLNYLADSFLKYFTEKCPQLIQTSTQYQEKIKKSYISFLGKVNQNRLSPEDSGEDLRKGELGYFLISLTTSLVLIESELTEIDISFTKEFVSIIALSIAATTEENNQQRLA